ncbi:MAG TPA: IclR family transcriptional regulator [Mycobacteriales bacterium]|nr:IclR family transcriptional regulator [Mycobacteriales bacterium]
METALTAGGDADARAASPAVDRALTILETLVAADEPMTMTALAKVTDVPLATCASILRTLEARGYAARRVVGRSHFWRATLRISGLAAQLQRKADAAELAQPYLAQLVQRTNLPAHLGALEGNLVLYVAKIAAPGMVQFNTYTGKTTPFNLTALGRAIAAFLPDSELRPRLEHLASGKGPNAGKPTVAALRRLLNQVRDRGYAIEDQEEDPGISCVAAPYFDAQGTVLGSIGVTGFVEQVLGERREDVVAAVVEAAATLTQEWAGVGG